MISIPIMKNNLLVPFLSAALPALMLGEAAAQNVDPQRLLAAARQSIASMSGSFYGTFQQGVGRNVVPFAVSSRQDGRMIYRFNNPNESIQVRVGSSAGLLGGRFTEPVRGTDVTREDLSIWQLGWPATGVKEDRTSGFKCWKVSVRNPNGEGAYKSADVWIHQNSLALIRMDAYDASGNLARRLQVQKIKRFGDQQLGEQMRVISYENGRKQSTTYIQIAGEQS